MTAPVDFAALAAQVRQFGIGWYTSDTIAWYLDAAAALQKERDELRAKLDEEESCGFSTSAELERTRTALAEAESRPVAWIATKADAVLHFAVADGWEIETVLTSDRAPTLAAQLAAAQAECAEANERFDKQCALVRSLVADGNTFADRAIAAEADRDNWRAMSESESASAKFSQEGARTLIAECAALSGHCTALDTECARLEQECAALRKVFAEFLAALDHSASVDTTHDIAATLYYGEAEKAARAAIAQGKT